MHSLAIFGITGRMGQSLLQALRETPGLAPERRHGLRQSTVWDRTPPSEGAATGVIDYRGRDAGTQGCGGGGGFQYRRLRGGPCPRLRGSAAFRF